MARRRGVINVPQVMAEQHAAYRAGQETRFQSRLQGVDPSGSGADYHYRTERDWLHAIERARDYQRNDPIVGQGVRRLVANIIQGGFTLDTSTGNDQLDQLLWAKWQAWANNADECHSEGELTWQQMERLALSSVIVDGDIFALPLRSGSVQWVEAHRVRTPTNTTRNVIHGVLVDDRKVRKEYWITKQELGLNRLLRRVSEVKPYPARDRDGNRQVLHLYEPSRFSQTRGVSCMLPVSETIGQHSDLQFATLVKAQISALIAVLKTRDENWQPGGIDQTLSGSQSTDSRAGYIRVLEQIGAGLEIAGDPGEKIEAFSANVPSPQFFEHSMLILTFIAVNLDLPVAVLLLDPSNTNFSGWRGAIDQARIRFRQIQSWLIASMHSPLYRWKVRQWMASDRDVAALANMPGVDPFAHTWKPPTWSYIEPEKDVKSDVAILAGLQNSPRGVVGARGRDWETIVDETVQDYEYAIVAGLEAAGRINGQFPDSGVTWRDFISLPTATTMIQSTPEPEPPEETNGGRNAERA